MIKDDHTCAQKFAAKAGLLLSEGNQKKARKLFAEAAMFEKKAFLSVPKSKIRTRSILAVSFISMLYKAERYSEAEREIFKFLSQDDLLPSVHQQLRELLEAVWDERVLFENLKSRYVGTDIFIALRGYDIGVGTAPLDLVMHTTGGFKNLLYRMSEWKGDYEFRLRGLPPKEILALIQARAVQHMAGSYTLAFRLAEPIQLEVFPIDRVKAVAVSDAFFEFLHILNTGTSVDLESYIPKEEYRNAMLKLVRNIAPSRKRGREIAVYRDSPKGLESVLLTDNIKYKIAEALTVIEETIETGELVGTLRALHLDLNWLELALPDGERKRCDTIPDMLDDVVGPMVNQTVKVKGRWKVRDGKRKFLVEDIELAEEDIII